MPDLSVRSGGIELMDDLNCTGAVVGQTLKELEFINKWLGGNAVTTSAVKKLIHRWQPGKALHIADLGCGGGDMLRVIHSLAIRRGISVRLTGIDANPEIIDYARRNLRDIPHTELLALDIFSEAFRNLNFDIIIGTLFFHHFSSDRLIEFLSELKHRVTLGIVINDIHRHFLAYYSIRYLTMAFSKSFMVKHDAPLSVARAFSKEELIDILEKAGFRHYTIRWKWAFRWQIIIRTDK
jgi:2-polyprenyl-3-methyl-5-hydroxy-6-metoxy-1,4-benzoquinol methylase